MDKDKSQVFLSWLTLKLQVFLCWLTLKLQERNLTEHQLAKKAGIGHWFFTRARTKGINGGGYLRKSCQTNFHHHKRV